MALKLYSPKIVDIFAEAETSIIGQKYLKNIVELKKTSDKVIYSCEEYPSSYFVQKKKLPVGFWLFSKSNLDQTKIRVKQDHNKN